MIFSNTALDPKTMFTAEDIYIQAVIRLCLKIPMLIRVDTYMRECIGIQQMDR